MPKKSESHAAGREAHNPHDQSPPGQDRPANRGQSRGPQEALGGLGGDGGGQSRDRKMNEANKKGGCLPKLFMLTLPFVAAGAFLMLRS